jgi:hypothetical protein
LTIFATQGFEVFVQQSPFDHLAEIIEQFIDAIGLTKYSLYLMDYGAPIDYRIALEEAGEQIAAYIRQFVTRRVPVHVH